MLFILENDDKLRDPEDIDSAVSAEIPDEREDPILYNIVANSMMHGPCGSMNPNSPCMELRCGKLECTKNFPKPFCETTNTTRSGYPEYMRRDDGRTVTKGNHVLDNRSVVPYNPYLSKKYNAHINVEVCSTIKSVKYIFKYVYKGHDAAIVKIGEGQNDVTYNWDEIKLYIDARYISAPEAIWRLRAYLMQDRSHKIQRLAIHLPSQHNVVFSVEESESERDAILAAMERSQRKGTTLTCWFILNQEDQNANHLLYREVPYHYVYQTSKEGNKWKKRKQGQNEILSRMYAVSLKDAELFSLRLLLLHIRGAKGYEDLRTVNGVVYHTFKEAAKAMNLLDDDENWNQTMDEAIQYRMPSQLRMVFATILEFAKPLNPLALFLKYRNHLIEDYLLQYDEEISVDKCLQAIEEYLRQFGSSCNNYNLPSPRYISISPENVNPDFDVEIQQAAHQISMLNEEQRAAFSKIMDSIDGKTEDKCFFLSGAGGCGKTFLYSVLINTILGRRKQVKAVAPTGLAATLLKNGRTVHSGFGLSINIDETSSTRIRQGSPEWMALKETVLIIWDEISMSTSNLFNAVDRSLRDLLNTDAPFGGITIVVGGDFRQQAPVIKKSNRLKIIESCIKSSPLWSAFKELRLTQNMRVQVDEVEFMEWLLKIGSGRDHEDKIQHNVNFPENMLSTDIISSVFGNEIDKLSADAIASRAILCPLNEDTMRINETILQKLPGQMESYYSIDRVGDCENEEERQMYPVEFLNSLTPSGKSGKNLL